MDSLKTRALGIVLLCTIPNIFGIEPLSNEAPLHISVHPQQHFRTNRNGGSAWILARYTQIVRGQAAHTVPLHNDLITFHIMQAAHQSNNTNQETISGIR